MSRTPAIRLSGLSVTIDGTPIIRTLDWEVARDQRWVLVGPNGAGKTTLLRIAALRQHPSTGTVEVVGETLGRCEVHTVRKRIAYTSAAVVPTLEARMTAAQVVMTGRNAALAPWWHHYDADDRARALALLERFGAAALADHRLPTLSAGEQQRVLLARALACEPELLLLDEPTAGVDADGQEQFCGLLREFTHEGLTIILVSHDLPLITAHADRIACLNVTLHWHGRAAELDAGVVQAAYRCELQRYQLRHPATPVPA